MEERLKVKKGCSIPMSEIEVRASRSSGPGGQHANVTASKIEASFSIADSDSLTAAQRKRLEERFGARVTAVSQEARSQARNREVALRRLAEKIAEAITPPKPRRKTKPTRASKERRLEGKRKRSEVKRARRRPRGDSAE
jgi:ribosome-associated protein